MSEKFFNGRYRIAPQRAQWHDYDNGTYFITICTHGREHFFGEIVKTNGKQKMIPTPVGKYADEQIRSVQTHYPYAEIPSWVVMPDHVHCIVIIHRDGIPFKKRNIRKNRNIRNGSSGHGSDGAGVPNQTQTATLMQTWLSVVIRGIKYAVTRYARKNGIPFQWQTRFFDLIIRNDDDIKRVDNYIRYNVANWCG